MPAKKQKTRRTFVHAQKEEEQKDVEDLKETNETQEPEVTEETEVETMGADKDVEEHAVHSFQEEVLGDEKPAKKPFVSKHTIFYFLAFFFIGVALATAGYFYLQFQNAQKQVNNSSTQESQESEELVEKIGKLIELPTGEQPTIATVSDINLLKDQTFFEKAQNGDKVLIYAQAKKAYLFRPSLGKLIDVAPVTLPTPSDSTATASAKTVSEDTKVVLLNGSGVTGITRTAEATLTSELENITVLARENANNRDYAETIVVDVSGGNAEAIQNILEALNVGKKGGLPTDEEKPANADVLIILGQDYEE